MVLSDQQKDALTELINIGYGRAALALSELTGHRVTVGVPRVTLHPIDEIGSILESTLSPWVAHVNQSFSGSVSGNALLLMNEQSALVLGKILGQTPESTAHFDASTREILKEVGNILLNSCLGVFGNLLQIHMKFAVPRLAVDHVSQVIHRAAKDAGNDSTHGLLVHTRFHVKTADINGYLVIVLSVTSLDILVHELDGWERRQTS